MNHNSSVLSTGPLRPNENRSILELSQIENLLYRDDRNNFLTTPASFLNDNTINDAVDNYNNTSHYMCGKNSESLVSFEKHEMSALECLDSMWLSRKSLSPFHSDDGHMKNTSSLQHDHDRRHHNRPVSFCLFSFEYQVNFAGMTGSLT